MLTFDCALVLSILKGCFKLTSLAFGIGLAAVLLDYGVRLLEKRGVSKELCRVLQWMAMALVALDATLVISWAVWEFLELLPEFGHLQHAIPSPPHAG